MKKRLKLLSNKSGYLQIDFAFVVLIFFTFFYFIYLEQSSIDATFKNIDDVNLLSSNARDICFLLTKSSGYPKNWESDLNNFDYVGLKSSTNKSLDSSKILVFNDLNYFNIFDSLNISGYLSVDILGLNTNTDYLDFGNISFSGNLVSTYNCFSNYNGEMVRVNVGVWR